MDASEEIPMISVCIGRALHMFVLHSRGDADGNVGQETHTAAWRGYGAFVLVASFAAPLYLSPSPSLSPGLFSFLN